MGVEIAESPVTDESYESMAAFVYDYLEASVENEGDGGRMRWYPWHSAEYRFNHIMNVVELATDIAEAEGANADVVRVAALFHDIAKLEADQEVHAEAGARVARKYLESHGHVPASFIDQVCRAIEGHSHTGNLEEVALETQCLIEADLLDKIGANGITLMLLRMGYEARTHMDAGEMVQRVLNRGKEARKRVESDRAESLAHRRLTRVAWFRDWIEGEISEMTVEDEDEELT